MSLLPSSRLGVLWRALLAGLLVIGFAAGTTAVAGLLEFKQAADDLSLSKALISKHLTPPAPGQPQTLLLIGLDQRYGQGSGPGQTDTMMLVRINDASKTINLLSIPRDLGVNIPGVGFAKLNAAYEDGGKHGADLLLQTLQQDVIPGLEVNQLLVTTFDGFAKLVTSLGCVYSAVDRRYYNKNLGPGPTNWSNIDIEPGYQKLCGDNGSDNSALAFVRFRHGDSDLVRESRQQDFLRWGKSQWSANELLSKRNELLEDFGEDVQTDQQLHSGTALDNLFGLAYNADGSSIRSFPFQTTGSVSGAIGDYLTFSETQAQQTYAQFMTPTTTIPPVGHVALGSGTKHSKRRASRFTLPPLMTADPGDGRSQAAQVAGVGMPVYYPYYVPDDFSYCFSIANNCQQYPEPDSAYVGSYPRSYTIDGPGGTRYAAYVMTLVESSGTETEPGSGQFLNVQGTTWQNPPLLADPSLVRVVNGKRLDIYSQGGLVSTVAWHTRQGVYWIQNTLQNLISNQQMVAMAATLTRARG